MFSICSTLERRGGFSPRKLSGTGSVKERERDFAEPGSAGPPPPPRAPAAGAEFHLTGCAVPSRPETVHSEVMIFDYTYRSAGPGPARTDRQLDQKWPEMARNGLISSAIFCKCSTQLASMFLKKCFFLAPPFLGARGGPIRYFFFAKMEPNGQKWPQIRSSGGGAKTCK